MPLGSTSTSHVSIRPKPTQVLERVRWHVESDTSSARGTPTLLIDGVVHLGGCKAATLVEAWPDAPCVPRDPAMTLPELHLADWRATKDTLHLYSQIIGKIKLATTARATTGGTSRCTSMSAGSQQGGSISATRRSS